MLTDADELNVIESRLSLGKTLERDQTWWLLAQAKYTNALRARVDELSAENETLRAKLDSPAMTGSPATRRWRRRMPSKQAKIEACPWCGSKANWNHTSGGNGDGFSVLCDAFDCGVMGPQFKSKEAAVRAWNRVARAAKKARGKRG